MHNRGTEIEWSVVNYIIITLNMLYDLIFYSYTDTYQEIHVQLDNFSLKID